jgi:hypothetical protein
MVIYWIKNQENKDIVDLGAKWLMLKMGLYPLETLLRIYQKDSLIDKKTFTYTSVSKLIFSLYKHENIKGFYRGLSFALPGYIL